MEPFRHPLCLATPYLIGVVQQGDVEGDEPREASVREGEALHKEVLLVPVGAGHLVGQLVSAQRVPVGLARVLGTWEGMEGAAVTPWWSWRA